MCTYSAFGGVLALLALASGSEAIGAGDSAVLVDSPDACCTHKCCIGSSAPCCHPGPPCKAQQNQTACTAAHCNWANGKCASPPKPPPPPPPPPAVLPCTIAPLPPAPPTRGIGGRWASYWAGVPAYLNGTNADGVTKLTALLKANGGNATVTSLIVGCGDTIDVSGAFVPGVSQGCDALLPALDAMGIGLERTVGASAAGLRAAFKNPDPVIAAMVAMAKTQKLTGWGSDWEYPGTKADGLALTCFQAKLRAALRPVGTRLTMFTDDFDGFIDDLPDLQRSVDRLLCGDTYWCKSASPPPGAPSRWVEPNTIVARCCRLAQAWPPQPQPDRCAELDLVDDTGVQKRCELGG